MDGTKELLDFRLAEADTAEVWTAFLTDLKRRGLQGEALRLVTTDGGSGLIHPVAQAFPERLRQPWIAPITRNVVTKTRRRNRAAVGRDLSAVWAASSRTEALQAVHPFCQRWQTEEERAVRGLPRVIDDALVYHDFPDELWHTIRMTNVLERSVREVRRRTCAMGEVFVNEASLDRSFYAVVEHMNQLWKAHPLELISTN